MSIMSPFRLRFRRSMLLVVTDTDQSGPDSSDAEWIGLALSGGGFRATLFHLGVIRYFYDSGLLGKIKVVCSVSGGSILAAHLILNWASYVGSQEEFDLAAKEIIKFTSLDVRGRILRRWVFGALAIIPRALGKLTFTSLLINHYASLYKNRTLADLATSDQPALHILTTSLTTGTLCKFTSEGFRFEDGPNGIIRNGSLPVALAVAASSAFPPLFPPISLTHAVLNTDQERFPMPHALTDGGVFDNLGLEELSQLEEGQTSKARRLIVSNAGGNFDWAVGKRYSFIVSRNVRATDILMDRVSKLVPSLISTRSCPVSTIDIGFELTKSEEPSALPAEIQSSVRNIRTDLDGFSQVEVLSLIKHGYAQARFALASAQVSSSRPNMNWEPFGTKVEGESGAELKIEDARRRRWNLISLLDPYSWASMLLLLGWLITIVYVPLILISDLRYSRDLEVQEKMVSSLREDNQQLRERVEQLQNFAHAARDVNVTGDKPIAPQAKKPYSQLADVSIGNSFTDPKTNVRVGLLSVSVNNTANITLTIPGSKMQQVKDAEPGQSWRFKQSNTQFEVAVTKVLFIGDYIEVVVTELND